MERSSLLYVSFFKIISTIQLPIPGFCGRAFQCLSRLELYDFTPFKPAILWVRPPKPHPFNQPIFDCVKKNISNVDFKVACTSGPIFEKIMKRYPIFSVQIINHQIDQMHK